MDKNKKEPEKNGTLRTILIIFAAILFYMVLQNTALLSGWIGYVGRVLAPVFIGAGMAFVINLPLNLFERKVFAPLNKKKLGWWTKIRRAVCLVLSVLLLIGIFSLIIGLVVPEVRNTAVSIAKALPSQAEGFLENVKGWIKRLNLPVDVDSATMFNGIDWNSLSKEFLSGITNTGSTVISTTISLTSGILGGLFNFVIGFALSMYILASKEKLCGQAKRLIGAIMPERKSRRIFSVLRMSSDIFTKFITGQLTDALILGVFCYLGMMIFRMPYALMVSAIVSVTALIPVFGAFVGTAFGALMIMFVSPLKALGFVLYIIIFQQIDSNVIYPRIVGSSVGLPGIWVLVAVTVGGSLFGPLGMLLSVPVCAVLYCLISDYVEEKEKLREKEELMRHDETDIFK